MKTSTRVWRGVYNGLHGFGFPLELVYLLNKTLRQWKTSPEYIIRRFNPSVEQIKNRPSAWFHAVSVGEIRSLPPLLDAWGSTFPQPPLVTTLTATGYAAGIQLKIPNLTYVPYDLFPFPGIFLRRHQPVCLCILETELWPEIIWSAASRYIPIFVVNGRISDKAFSRYYRFRRFFAHVLKFLTGIAVQSETQRERWIELGAEPDRVAVTGNIKFDVAKKVSCPPSDPIGIKGWIKNKPLIVFGSWHPEEYPLLNRVLKQLKDIPDLYFCIAPRQIHKKETLIKGLQHLNISYTMRSTGRPSPTDRVFVLDSIGELYGVYAYATIAVVGGSFYKNGGGHNPIEPASLSKPVIMGPYFSNFRDIVDLFMEKNALVISYPEHLARDILNLLSDMDKRIRLGRNALRLVKEQQGASQRTVAFIREHDHVPEMGKSTSRYDHHKIEA